MADDGHVLLDATGRRIMRDDGSLDICEECCVSPCQYCSGSTPKTITVVTSGIYECVCSTGVSGQSGEISISPSISPNGTFVLTQNVSVPCLYEYSSSCSGEYKIYLSMDPLCEGVPIATTNINTIKLTLRFTSATTWLLFCVYNSGVKFYICHGTILSGDCFIDDSKNNEVICNGELFFDGIASVIGEL
jgi:hypothetical protein